MSSDSSRMEEIWELHSPTFLASVHLDQRPLRGKEEEGNGIPPFHCTTEAVFVSTAVLSFVFPSLPHLRHRLRLFLLLLC